MTQQSARATAIILLGVTALGCKVDLTGLDLSGFGLGSCGEASSASCQQVSLSGGGAPVLLLGDTAGFSAYTGGGYTDIQWEHSTPAISFVGSPIAFSRVFSSLSHVVVKGDAVGLSIVTARRMSYSASASVEVIPASFLRDLTITRVHCAQPPAGLCEPNSSLPAFRDTLVERDTARVIGAVRDVSGRTVAATIKWSTSDSNVAVTALAFGFPDSATVVVGVAPGDAIITGAVGGLTSSFALHVVK